MGLNSTLFTGLSGLDVNQTRLNVVGNNIANVNTVAFKSSRALFKPQFYVTDSAGAPPSADFGGQNPSQRGLGASVSTIEKDFSPGQLEPTGKPTDLAIDGDGFFVVEATAGQMYTRDGSFSLNAANELVDSGGNFVQGFGVDGNFNIIPGTLQKVTIPLGQATSAKETSTAEFQGNLNADGAVSSGASILTSQLLTIRTGGVGTAPPAGTTLLTDLASTSDVATGLLNNGDVITLAGSRGGRTLAAKDFTVTAASTVDDLTTFFNASMGIDATVPDDGDPLTPTAGSTIETDIADPTSARLVITGNLGGENALSISGSGLVTQANDTPFAFADGTNAAGIDSNPAGESVSTSFVAYDSLGTPLTVDVVAAMESKSNMGNVWRFYATSGDDTDPSRVLGTGTLTFDADGKLLDSTGTSVTLNRDSTGARTPLAVQLDFSGMTSLTSRDSEMVMTRQDGTPIGTLNAFSIGADGKVMGSYSNGITQTLGQVAVATFKNNLGLVDRGGNMFQTGPSSGMAVISSPQNMGAGSIRSGSLELSNVDLSEQFVNMIIASTGFSASSRVISTSDQLITELLNTTR